MEGDTERICRYDQLAANSFIDIPMAVECADDHAVATQLRAHPDVAQHHVDLVCAVAEVTSARADQCIQRNAQPIACDGERAVGGRRAAVAEVSAQLDAIGATFLRSECRAQRVGRDLEHGPDHRTTLPPYIDSVAISLSCGPGVASCIA